MKKQVIPGDEARTQILEGAKLLYDAVSTTLGPKGNNAVIEAYGEPIVTHDGVTVAKAIEVSSDDRPGVRVGVELIKSSSSKTNDNVGDGTTSSTILAYHLIDQGLKCIERGKNPMVLRRELDEAAKIVLDKLETLKEEVKTKEAMIQVATISSENAEIGKKVGTMYHKLGKDAMVAVEIGTKPETEYEIVEGYTFDRGMLSPFMVTDSRTQTTTLINPAVLIINGKADKSIVDPFVADLWNEGKDSLLVICDDFKQDLLDAALIARDKVTVVGVKSPGFGDQKLELLKDLAKLTGTEIYKESESVQLGTIKKAVVSLKETVLTGGQDVSEHISDLETRKEALKAEADKEKIDKRIAQLRGKVGLIRVGGATEMEAEERKYLIDDAVCATEAAIKEGIVPGGGTTYVELSTLGSGTDGSNILNESLRAPFKVLMTNAGERSGVKLEEYLKAEYGQGFDVLGSGEIIDLKQHGIIDPVLVIKQAITNAVSVAGSALTTGVLIVNEKEKDEEEK